MLITSDVKINTFFIKTILTAEILMQKTVKTGKIAICTLGHPIYTPPAASLAHSFYGSNSLSSASDQYQCRYPYFSNKASASVNLSKNRRG